MATRRSFRCPTCGTILEESRSLFDTSIPVCQNDGAMMESYFGNLRGSDLHISYGFRENRYRTQEDANIAQFQFTNL